MMSETLEHSPYSGERQHRDAELQTTVCVAVKPNVRRFYISLFRCVSLKLLCVGFGGIGLFPFFFILASTGRRP
jgi:hypothetical protein